MPQIPVLTQFTVEKYRCFQHPARVPLAPLTLVYGHNSAGKSALVRFLPGLAASFADPFPGGALHFGTQGAWPDLRLTDLVWGGGLKLPFRLRFGDQDFAWTLTCDPDGRNPVVDSGPSGLEPGDGLRLGGEGPLPPALRAFAESVAWVERWRGVCPRDPVQSPAAPRGLSLSLPEAAQWLWHNQDGHGVIDALNEFYGSLEGGPTLRVRPDGAHRFRMIVERRGLYPVDLAEEGEGLSQVLPVLAAVERGRAGKQSIVCIEQPELHLHPHAQRMLADHLIRAVAGEGPLRLLVETHSEHLVLATQLALIEGRLRPDQVALLWVGPRPNPREGAELREARLDRAGRDAAQVWPRDVFDEDNLLARRIVAARRERGL